MSIKIASWNIEARLSSYKKKGRGSADHILGKIATLDADVIVLLEAYMDALAPGIKKRLRQLGYEVVDTLYGDYGRETEPYMNGAMHMLVLSKLAIEHTEVIRPADVRNLLVCYIRDPKTGKKLRIIATHLEDRSEAQRLKQAEKIAVSINKSKLPTIMLGDFNAMWHIGRARLVGSRFVKLLAKFIPHREIRWTIIRANEMASGRTLHRLTRLTDLYDTDLRKQPTATPKKLGMEWLPAVRLIQIDHILLSSELEASNFKVHGDGGSDHRAISATISVR